MCVIAFKSINAKFPTKETLEICWDNNPDGAGFMYAADNTVHIRKGFMTFDDFWKALQKVRTKYGDKIACVMHFRIGTQGGNIPANTHPFPLSKKMDKLRLLKTRTDIGVAHNGIIELTSDYSKKVDYSDTMRFITKYLSLIIHDIHWYKSKDTCKLIERLIQSRLCVLDKESHIQLLGDGWNEDDSTGVWYSNHSWEASKVKYSSLLDSSIWNNSQWTKNGYYDDWDMYLDDETKLYDFDESYCPAVLDGEDAYCEKCRSKGSCSYLKMYMNSLIDNTTD